jgi:outer membrane protein OmpA-like peptidoglycan-associated protein
MIGMQHFFAMIDRRLAHFASQRVGFCALKCSLEETRQGLDHPQPARGGNMKTVIATAGLIALGVSGAAGAAEKAPKEETIGVLSGLAVGAAAGGPIGAFIGAVVGAKLGDRYHVHKQESAQLKERLRDSDQTLTITLAELKSSKEQLAASKEQIASLTDELRAQPVPPSVQRTLRGEIMFRTNDAALSTDTSAYLSELAQLLNAAPAIVVKVEGYADPRGSEGANLTLSQQRAASVRDALLAGGIAEDRIMVVAHGEGGSTSTEGDVDGYALDRRVVLTISAADSQVAQSQDAP